MIIVWNEIRRAKNEEKIYGESTNHTRFATTA